MSDVRRNLELKAAVADLAAARLAACQLGARCEGIELQTDTYFRVPAGRLKLREIVGRPAVLIWYERPNQTEVRGSSYCLVPVADPAGLRTALTAALGVRGVVRKKREIHLWHNVRIHLDEVEHLGSFIEFEAVLAADADEAVSRERLARLGEALRIQPETTQAGSYADLLGS